MQPHEVAQSVAWFVFAVYIGIAIVLWADARKECKNVGKN